MIKQFQKQTHTQIKKIKKNKKKNVDKKKQKQNIFQ